MRKNIFIILGFLVVSACVLYCCREESGTKKDELEVTSSLAAPEIDVQKITEISGIPFILIKAQTEGYMPKHRFYWVCVEEKIPQEDVETLADAIIKHVIDEKPSTYHSFTIHFFCRENLQSTPEASLRFAHANFLPDGTWLNVGRAPIDGYDRYRLVCTYLEE